MTRRASAPRGELGVMKLKGRQILVLDTEYLIAIDVQNMLEQEGATVTAGDFGLNGDGNFDCVVTDHESAQKSLVGRLHAAGIPLVAYTGNREAIEKLFPHAFIVNKPSSPGLLTAAVAHAISPPPPDDEEDPLGG